MDLEELHRVVVRGFASINDRLDSELGAVNGRIDGLSGRMDGLSGRMDGLSGRMDGLSDRMDGLSDRMDGLSDRIDALGERMDTEFAFVKDAILEHGRQLKDIRATLDRKVDRDEVEGLVERAVARATGH